jgi:hypothetical protein
MGHNPSTRGVKSAWTGPTSWSMRMSGVATAMVSRIFESLSCSTLRLADTFQETMSIGSILGGWSARVNGCRGNSARDRRIYGSVLLVAERCALGVGSSWRALAPGPPAERIAGLPRGALPRVARLAHTVGSSGWFGGPAWAVSPQPFAP